MNMKKTSCIILNYNDAETTIKLLNAIRNYSTLSYIIIVDNLSTDNSFKKLKVLENGKIHVLLAEKNGGYGYGNNIGIRYSYSVLETDYVLIANPDVVFSEDCLKKLIATLQNDSNVALVSAKQSNSLDSAWKNCSILQYVLSTSLFFEIWMKIRCYPQNYFKGKIEAEVFALPGSLLMIDTKKMLQVGMFDEDFFLYYEEPILAQKFLETGFKTILRLDTSYIHDHHLSISKTYKQWSAQHRILLRSAELFLQKYKHANAFQITLARLWFAYTKVEFTIYDFYRKIKG